MAHRDCGPHLSFESDFWEFSEQYKSVRDEITHPKLRDHAIYRDMDAANPTAIEKAVARALVILYVAREMAWPYWLLSWNYVGLNADPTWPVESNNLNGFYHSLPALGISTKGLGGQTVFEKTAMSTLMNFDDLDALMQRLTVSIETFDPRFPRRPRLTRRWWDSPYLRAHADKSEAH